LGNTPRVAEKHYLQVTDDHFAQATAEGGAGGGAQVVQQVVPQPAATDRKELQQRKKASGLTAMGAENPEASEWCSALDTGVPLFFDRLAPQASTPA
jgi:hypothetical protein